MGEGVGGIPWGCSSWREGGADGCPQPWREALSLPSEPPARLWQGNVDDNQAEWTQPRHRPGRWGPGLTPMTQLCTPEPAPSSGESEWRGVPRRGDISVGTSRLWH